MSESEKVFLNVEMKKMDKSGMDFECFAKFIGPIYFRKLTPQELQGN
jgi:hypothetical protein